MNVQRSLAGSAALILMASLVGGCADFDYRQHTDRISFRAGDAVKANLERETTNPSGRSMYDVSGLGENGSVLPLDPSASGGSPTQGTTSTGSPPAKPP